MDRQEPVQRLASKNEASTHAAALESQGTRRGPRTAAGKINSSRNARKHGLLSKLVVLKGELQAEFDSLMSGLREDLEPEGSLEEILVEKLATLLWRYRRLIVAETAEIEKGSTFLEWDEQERQQKEAEEAFDGGEFDCDVLMRKIANPQILQRCLELLGELKEDIEENGFNEESDRRILRTLYGESEHWIETLAETYQIWWRTANCSDEEREQGGYASVEQCKTNFLERLRVEITRLKHYGKGRAYVEAERLKLEALRRSIPDPAQLDRLLRYEVNLERAIDRTLTQLERHQRMRLGQPMPPSVDIKVSNL